MMKKHFLLGFLFASVCIHATEHTLAKERFDKTQKELLEALYGRSFQLEGTKKSLEELERILRETPNTSLASKRLAGAVSRHLKEARNLLHKIQELQKETRAFTDKADKCMEKYIHASQSAKDLLEEIKKVAQEKFHYIQEALQPYLENKEASEYLNHALNTYLTQRAHSHFIEALGENLEKTIRDNLDQKTKKSIEEPAKTYLVDTIIKTQGGTKGDIEKQIRDFLMQEENKDLAIKIYLASFVLDEVKKTNSETRGLYEEAIRNYIQEKAEEAIEFFLLQQVKTATVEEKDRMEKAIQAILFYKSQIAVIEETNRETENQLDEMTALLRERDQFLPPKIHSLFPQPMEDFEKATVQVFQEAKALGYALETPPVGKDEL